jgi:hypothetical protein
MSTGTVRLVPDCVATPISAAVLLLYDVSAVMEAMCLPSRSLAPPFRLSGVMSHSSDPCSSRVAFRRIAVCQTRLKRSQPLRPLLPAETFIRSQTPAWRLMPDYWTCRISARPDYRDCTVYITAFHIPNLLILPNTTTIRKHYYGVYYVPFKWQLPSSAPTSNFRMAVLGKCQVKKWSLYFTPKTLIDFLIIKQNGFQRK